MSDFSGSKNDVEKEVSGNLEIEIQVVICDFSVPLKSQFLLVIETMSRSKKSR